MRDNNSNIIHIKRKNIWKVMFWIKLMLVNFESWKVERANQMRR